MTPTQTTCETPSVGGIYLELDEGDDSDHDDDLEFEILQGFLDQGFSLYKDGKWASAQNVLKRAIEALKLPPENIHQRGIDLKEAQFHIALCAFQKITSTRMLRFNYSNLGQLDRGGTNQERMDLEVSYRYIYLLRSVFKRGIYLGEAYKHCRKAHSMKRKLMGKEPAWLEINSFNLMMEIANAKEDMLTVEVYHPKELEYTRLYSRTEAYMEPSYQMLELRNIMQSRVTKVKATEINDLATQRKPRVIRNVWEWECMHAEAGFPLVVLNKWSASKDDGVLHSELNELARKFKPGTFVYYLRTTLVSQNSLDPDHFSIYYENSKPSYRDLHGTLAGQLKELKILLKDKQFDKVIEYKCLLSWRIDYTCN